MRRRDLGRWVFVASYRIERIVYRIDVLDLYSLEIELSIALLRIASSRGPHHPVFPLIITHLHHLSISPLAVRPGCSMDSAQDALVSITPQ
jgi:hypothetical protein